MLEPKRSVFSLLTRSFLILAVLLASAHVSAQKQPKPTDRPFLWRIEGDAPSFLYGTIHVPDKRITTLPKIVQKSLEASDVVLTEIRMDSMGNALKSMYLGRGKKLQDLLPEKTYSRLEAYLESRGFPIQQVQRFKVWAAMFTLLQVEIMRVSRGATKPLDQIIWNEGRIEDKELDALETLDEQLGVFEGFAVDEQVEMLNGTLDLLEEEGQTYLAQMIDLYLKGDLQKLEKFSLEHVGVRDNKKLVAKYMKLLLTDRNIRMADRMVKKMRDHPKKRYFFAVGALHYPGEQGILALLRKKGYRTTRLAERTVEPAEKKRPVGAGR